MSLSVRSRSSIYLQMYLNIKTETEAQKYSKLLQDD